MKVLSSPPPSLPRRSHARGRARAQDLELTPCNVSHKMPEEQRLLKDDTPLEDAKSLAEYRIENDDVLALTYKLPGK